MEAVISEAMEAVTSKAMEAVISEAMEAVQRVKTIRRYHQVLSLKLAEVMEEIGINSDISRLMTKEAALREIVHTITFHPDLSIYICGSTYEGTTTEGMDSDIDFVNVCNDLPVMTDCQETTLEQSLLFVQDESTPPGYAKVQLMKDGVPLTEDIGFDKSKYFLGHKDTLAISVDTKGRLVYTFEPDKNYYSEFTRHGPAMSRAGTPDFGSSDWVLALEMSRLPECVGQWFTRKRYHNWPSPHILQRCKTMGCLLVPVGHPRSDHSHLQWRLSLSKQERMLVSKFNVAQLNCYIVLKLIKKDILYRFLQEDSLSSYHIKTCMLYMIENTPEQIWQQQNLTHCIISCIKVLHLWVKNGFCPNYFIPDENMFEGKIEGRLKDKLQHYLKELLDADFMYLIQIGSDTLGKRLFQSLSAPPQLQVVKHCPLKSKELHCLLSILKTITYSRNLILRKHCDFILTGLFETVVNLRKTKTISDHPWEDSQTAISLILPYLELSFIANLIALVKKKGEDNATMWSFLSSNKWDILANELDTVSVKLKQAAIMYTEGYHEESLHLLLQLKSKDKYSICSCERFKYVSPDTDTLMAETTGLSCITGKYLLGHFMVPCVVFLPGEDICTPAALRYEMNRGRNMPETTMDEESYFWYDWAVVDGLFFIHFLLYLNHSSLQKKSEAAIDIQDMEKYIETKHVSHRDTCLNLLGWAYKNSGFMDRAVEIFTKSLEIKPMHNAALQHLTDTEVAEIEHTVDFEKRT